MSVILHNYICSVTEAPTRPPVAVDPCLSEPCGPFSQCRTQGGKAACSCLPGYIGDPYSSGGCEDPNECRTNRDCGDNLACAGDGSGYRKCVNPCDRAQCGANTRCLVVNHRPQCQCLDKHVGNPNQALGCIKTDVQGKKTKSAIITTFFYLLYLSI